MQKENKRGFASDNNSGVHPEILKAVEKVNIGHTIGYGDDVYTESAIRKFKEHFGDNIDVFFVFNGTAANVLGLKAATNSFHSIICADTSHINQDECGAAEKFTGCKVITVPSHKGKITVEQIRKHYHGIDFEHHSQPRVISITQATELGTVYSPAEISNLTEYAHRHNMLVHIDGARICNAAASLNCELKEITTDVGIDILSFGGTKNGLMFGEALIFFNKKLSENFKYYRKQGMQLFSKMRFIAAQFERLLTGDLWRENALHSNKMAKLLASEIADIPIIKITQEVETNGVFAIIPKEHIPVLQKEFFFYMWDEERSEIRWMTSFDTTEEDVYDFASLIRRIVK